MKVLVTGSAGRVGRAMTRALLDAGQTVRGFDLRSSGVDDARYDEVLGSFSDPEPVRQAVRNVESILHLGAFMSWVPAEREAMFRANVEGTRLLTEAAVAAGVTRFVFASSGEVYPENAPVSLPIDESHPLLASSPYGLTKLLGEEIVAFHQRTGGLDTVILRFSHTQDATELLDESSMFSGPRFFLRQRIRQQRSFGNGVAVERLEAADPGRSSHVLTYSEQGRPVRMHITDTRDIVRGLLLAREHPDAVGERFNLGATDPVDFVALLDAMSGVTGYPIVSVQMPGSGVDYHTANDKIRTRLGFQPQWTIDRMLQDAAADWRRRHPA